MCVRARWHSPFPPWVVNLHGPAWKPALSRAAPTHLTSPATSPAVAIQVQSAGKSSAGKPSARHPAPPSNWTGCPALGSFSFTLSLSFPGRRSLACPSLLPQRPQEGRGLGGSFWPHWVWLLALEGFPGKRRQHLSSPLTQAGTTAHWVPRTPRLKGLVLPPTSSLPPPRGASSPESPPTQPC